MWTNRDMPVGKENFKIIRDEGKYYIDKTSLIDDVLSHGNESASLFTRPRRFGKTLNLSMLDAYLNRDYVGNTWFDGLKISEIRPDDPEKNSNIVVTITLKDLGDGRFDMMLDYLRMKVTREFCTHFKEKDLKRMNPEQQLIFHEMMSDTPPEYVLGTSLQALCELIHECHGVKPILLIDEYDSIMNYSYGEPDRDRITGFMRQFLGSALKSNPHLKFAVLTGVMKVSKESIFSGLNNLWVNDVLSKDSDEAYGFTPEEVRKLCEDLDVPEKFEEARRWYDGYRFGNAEIYNPWSVMEYARRRFEPDEYWASTSGNSIIDDLVSMLDEESAKDLRTLCSGETVCMPLDRNISYGELHSDPRAVYSIMVMAGYLTAKSNGERYDVSIPNLELYRVFGRMISAKVAPGSDWTVSLLVDALESGDDESAEMHLGRLMEILSVRILGDEKVYQAFIAGLMASYHGKYMISVDREAGNGYYDVLMKSMRGDRSNILIEIKRCREGDPKKAAEKGLEQIAGKGYASGLEGRTMAYGIAFDGKVPTVVHRELDV